VAEPSTMEFCVHMMSPQRLRRSLSGTGASFRLYERPLRYRNLTGEFFPGRELTVSGARRRAVPPAGPAAVAPAMRRVSGSSRRRSRLGCTARPRAVIPPPRRVRCPWRRRRRAAGCRRARVCRCAGRPYRPQVHDAFPVPVRGERGARLLVLPEVAGEDLRRCFETGCGEAVGVRRHLRTDRSRRASAACLASSAAWPSGSWWSATTVAPSRRISNCRPRRAGSGAPARWAIPVSSSR
jgi:hypothetical protein